MNETLVIAYFVIWFALAIGTFLFFMGRDPAFKTRWHRRVAVFNVAVIGGMIILLAVPLGSAAVALSTVATLYFLWVAVFQIRVCLGCGQLCQPRNLITAEKFCGKCGTALE
jgi:hypothetical protein